VLIVEGDGLDIDEIVLQAIDAGAEDVKAEKGYLEIHTRPEELETVRKALEEKTRVISAELSLVPKTTVLLDEDKAVQTLNFLDQLEELDDVQRVFSNIDFSDSTLERLRSQA
jgi:transcriptional/translational regulatory protein YebC/TACO1